MLPRPVLLMGALLLPSPALAASPAHDAVRVRLAGNVFVEHVTPTPGGGPARVLEPAGDLHSGDRLVFLVRWAKDDGDSFVVTNPVPRSIAWQPSSSALDDEVSVDGGRTWGRLDQLKVHDGGVWRDARPGDVTHVRWHVAGGRAGQITYRGIVR